MKSREEIMLGRFLWGCCIFSAGVLFGGWLFCPGGLFGC